MIGKGAILSPDGVYRYRLWRTGLLDDVEVAASRLGKGIEDYVLWIMLNPSTATDTVDDATIRKCIGFSQRWGFNRLDVVNLYAYRATDPKTLGEQASKDPGRPWDPGRPRDLLAHLAGPENDRHILEAAKDAESIVYAWGSNPLAKARRGHVDRLLCDAGIFAPGIFSPTALKLSKDGMPYHPLYVPYDTKLVVLR